MELLPVKSAPVLHQGQFTGLQGESTSTKWKHTLYPNFKMATATKTIQRLRNFLSGVSSIDFVLYVQFFAKY